MRYRFIPLLILAAWASVAGAQPADARAMLEQANEAYRSANYRAAIEGYEALLSAGYRSEALHYNLGNSYYRDGQPGLAVLHYERARLLDPGDADIAHNLEVVRRQLPDDLEPLPGFFLARWWGSLRGLLTPAWWGIVGLVLLWGGAAGMVFWIAGRSRRQRKWGFVAGLALLLLSALPFALGISRQALLRDSGRAVVLVGETTLRSAPDPQSQARRTLHAGVAVDLLDAIGAWRRVRLPNGEEGWLPAENLEKV